MIDVAAGDQLPDQLALLGGPRKGREQGQELAPVPGAGVLLEGPPQGAVHGPGLRGDLVDVGGEEGEGVVGLALVLGQMEADAADDIPDGAVSLQVTLDAIGQASGLGGEGLAELGPQLAKHLRRDQLGAEHRWGSLGEAGDLVGLGDRKMLRFGGVGGGAGFGHEGLAKVAPVGQGGVQVDADLPGAQVEQAGAAACVEGLEDPPLHGGREERAFLGAAGVDVDAAARRQGADEGALAAGFAGLPRHELCVLLIGPNVQVVRWGDLECGGAT